MSTGNSRLQQNLCSRLNPGNELTNLFHYSGNITAENMWQRNLDAGQTSAHKQIQMVERAGLHLDQHLISSNDRLVDVRIFEDVTTPVLPEQHCFHDMEIV